MRNILLINKPSNITKNKTVSDFRTHNGSNVFLSKTTESSKKFSDKNVTSKSTSGLLSASVNNERANSLTSNVNHSTKKAKEPSTTKRSNIALNVRSISSGPTVKRPSVASTTATTTTTTTAHKTEAQVEHQKDQPLDRRQLSNSLESSSSTVSSSTTTTVGGRASTTALER